MRIIRFLAAFALPCGARAGMVINEIHYAPDPKTLAHEFIEFYNAGPATVDLSGWAVTDGVDFTFPAGTTLDAGAYLLLAENPAALTAAWFPPPAAGSASYDFTTVPNGSAFPGTTLTGQDGWAEPGGGTGVKVRNDLNIVPGFSGNNAYNSAAGVYATRKNNAAFTYAIPAAATTLTLSLAGRINSTAVAAFGPGVDSSNNGSINAANSIGEYGFEFGYLSNTWFIRQAAQGAVTQGPNLGLGPTGHSWYMELRVDLAANAGDGAGSLFVRQLGDTSNNPVNDTLQAVPSLQNVNLGIKRMSANGGNSSPSAWNGIITRVGAGNIDALGIAWSGGGGANPPQMLTFTGRLSNEGEQITLRDAAGLVQDEVDYQAEFPWPVHRCSSSIPRWTTTSAEAGVRLRPRPAP
jgi:Lamin Tail Domain